MASVDILTHVQNIYNIIHNTVGNSLPLIYPSVIVQLSDSIFAYLMQLKKRNEETTFMMIYI